MVAEAGFEPARGLPHSAYETDDIGLTSRFRDKFLNGRKGETRTHNVNRVTQPYQSWCLTNLHTFRFMIILYQTFIN